MTRQAKDHRPDGVVDLLKVVLAGAPKLSSAACRTEPELFDPQAPTESRGAAERRHEAAVRVCLFTCPDYDACLAWIDELEPSERPAGVIAGQRPPLGGRPRAGGGAPREDEDGAATAGGVALFLCTESGDSEGGVPA